MQHTPGYPTSNGTPGVATVNVAGAVPPGTYPPQSPTAVDSYFTESRKGEVNELRQLLRGFSLEKDMNRKRDIIKKVIAYMTLGIDVSRLFSEMMLVIETRDLVVKKMVYLFLCNYATSHPELAQMCTNTLQKDCGNEDPMVRGLALRALCSLRLPQMVEYISEPLRRSLTDSHAYVRKTGVMGILKLYYLDQDAFESCNFVDILYDMLRDPDASVVSNCIWVLNEIMARGPDGGMAINRPIMLHLFNRIHEFSEFGIVAVLDLVPRYRPLNDEETFQIMNLLDPILRTSNSAAVVATVRAFLALAEYVGQGHEKQEMTQQVIQRIKAPIVTLVSGGSPELIYALLKHIDALIDLAPGMFDDDYRQFYVRYTEPTHIQYLKVQILPKLVNPHNSQEIVSELAEYVADTDIRLSRLSVRALANIACHASGGPNCEEAIVLRLVEMLDLDVGHVPAEAATALSLVLRKHPSLNDLVAHRLPRALRYISEPNGKASVVWLLGETGAAVKEAPYALEKLIDSYSEVTDPRVKIALLTATMKLFFHRPPECQRMLGRLLQHAIDDVSNQDLHDRALLYHRLLKTSPKVAQAVVGGASSTIAADKVFAEEDDAELRTELMKEFNTLSTIYGKSSEHFIAEEYQYKLVVMPEYTDASPASVSDPLPVLETQMEQTTLSDTPSYPVQAVSEVTDLLDFGYSPTPAPATTPIAPTPITPTPTPTLNLFPSLTMTSDSYQSIWSSIPDAQSTTINIPLSKAPTSTSDVENLLSQIHVFTMASGELPTEFKFFLYCKEEQHFLIQAVLGKQSPTELALVIKAEGGKNEKMDLLVEKIQLAFRQFL